MTVKEVRAFPVSDTVVMRSALFALANMGATLQTYNEESGVIVATVSRWMGIQKKEVVVRVRPFEGASQIELDAPDIEKANEILDLLSTYIRDGARVQANATIQWVDLARQQAKEAQRREFKNRARSLLTGNNVAEPAPTEAAELVVPEPQSENQAIAVSDTDPAVPVVTDGRPIYIPDNPGVLVKNRQNMLIELKVDPEVFTDRSAYLTTCNVCYATALNGSAYCPNCGRPLTLEAVQPEMRQGAQRAAGATLTYGLIGVAFNIVPALVLVVPALLAEGDLSLLEGIRETISPVTIALAAVLGLLPAVVAAIFALRNAQRSSWYQNLPAVGGDTGRGRASIGNALGWLAIYLAAAWVLLIVIALL